MRALLASILVAVSAPLWADTTTYEGLTVPITRVPATSLALTEVGLSAQQLTEIRMQSTLQQAEAVNTLLHNWMTAYADLDTSGLYPWNHFTLQAQAIIKQAQTTGFTDAILSECAAFAAAIKQAEAGR